MNAERIFDPTCGHHHLADVTLDDDGFPVVRWVELCDRGSARNDAIDRLGAAAGTLLGIAVDVGDTELAEKILDQALGLNDPKESP